MTMIQYGIATRSDTIAVYDGLLAYAKKTLGQAPYTAATTIRLGKPTLLQAYQPNPATTSWSMRRFHFIRLLYTVMCLMRSGTAIFAMMLKPSF